MSESNSSGGGGLGIGGVVTVVFITLKALEVDPVANWSWGFVLFGPLLITLAFWFVFFGLIAGVLGASAAGSGFSRWMGRRHMSRMMQQVYDEEAKEAEEDK